MNENEPKEPVELRLCEHCGKEFPKTELEHLEDGTYLCKDCNQKAKEQEAKPSCAHEQQEAASIERVRILDTVAQEKRALTAEEREKVDKLRDIAESRICENCGKLIEKDKAKAAGRMTYTCEKCAPIVQRKYDETLPRAAMTFGESIDVKRLFNAINELATDEVTFSVDEKGLHTTVMDPSRCAMIDYHMEKAAFEEYLCTVPGSFVVNLDNVLKKVLKNAASNGTERLVFTVGYGKAGMQLVSDMTRVFTVPIEEPGDNAEKVPLPKIAYTVHAKLVLEGLRKILKDVEEAVMFQANDESILFAEKTCDNGMNVSVTLNKGDPNLLDLEVKEPAIAKYNSTWLKTFCESTYQMSDILKLEFSTDMPCKLTAILGHGQEFAFWLAPRIETE